MSDTLCVAIVSSDAQSVSFRHYFFGSFVGLLGPVTFMVIFLDKVRSG